MGQEESRSSSCICQNNFDDLSCASDASFSEVSDSADESYIAAAAAAYVKRGKSRDKRKRSKRKSQGVSANLAHVSKHAVVLSARSSAARVSKSAQVNAAIDDEDSDVETRQVKRKSKKFKKSNRGSCSSIGMTATSDDSDDAGNDEDDKRIRKAFQSASASTFPCGSSGRAASCMMARAKATHVPNHVSRQASSSRSGSAFSVQVGHLVSPPQELRHVIPECFMLRDSGATHHMLFDMMFSAHLRDKYLQVSWGDSSSLHSLGIGHLISWQIFQALVLDVLRQNRVF